MADAARNTLKPAEIDYGLALGAGGREFESPAPIKKIGSDPEKV